MSTILEQAVRKRFLEEQEEKKQREELIEKALLDYVNGIVAFDKLPHEAQLAIHYALGKALGKGEFKEY